MHIHTYIYFSSITGDLANLTEPFALMASETKPAPLYCLGTVTTSGMTNLATPEDNLSAKICPFPTLILSGTRTLALTSLKFIHAFDYLCYTNYPVCPLKHNKGIMLQTIYTSHSAETEIKHNLSPSLDNI